MLAKAAEKWKLRVGVGLERGRRRQVSFKEIMTWWIQKAFAQTFT